MSQPATVFAYPLALPLERGKERLAYLDWLRFFVVLSLAPFHAALSYTGWGSVYVYDDPIRNDILSGVGLYHSLHFSGLRYYTIFMDNWFMHLLFLIAGISACHSLKKRDPGSFIGERARRLTLPLLFGTTLVIPIQSWLGALDFRTWKGNLLAFYPRFFASHFEWGHLWFLGYLFIFSLLALPLFMRWERWGPPAFLVSILSRGVGALSPALLFGFLEALFRPGWPGRLNLVNDWANFTVYFGYFVLGYALGSKDILLERVERLRYGELVLGVFAFLARLGTGYVLPVIGGYTPGTMLAEFFRGLASWGLVLAALGFGRRYLGRGPLFAGPAYDLARDLSFPLYFFHFIPVTAVTYLLLGTGLSVPLRWAITVLAAWASVAITTELIRLSGRPLCDFFGIRVSRRARSS
jgi:glucan biosynthesis protein C